MLERTVMQAKEGRRTWPVTIACQNKHRLSTTPSGSFSSPPALHLGEQWCLPRLEKREEGGRYHAVTSGGDLLIIHWSCYAATWRVKKELLLLFSSPVLTPLPAPELCQNEILWFPPALLRTWVEWFHWIWPILIFWTWSFLPGIMASS